MRGIWLGLRQVDLLLEIHVQLHWDLANLGLNISQNSSSTIPTATTDLKGDRHALLTVCCTSLRKIRVRLASNALFCVGFWLGSQIKAFFEATLSKKIALFNQHCAKLMQHYWSSSCSGR